MYIFSFWVALLIIGIDLTDSYLPFKLEYLIFFYVIVLYVWSIIGKYNSDIFYRLAVFFFIPMMFFDLLSLNKQSELFGIFVFYLLVLGLVNRIVSRKR